jgi:biotin-(acetyl-CoA carboxylase) ligase
MSVVLPHGGAAPHTTLLVGLAVAKAIEDVAREVRVGIMIRGGKVGGILCESVGSSAVAGIGINLRSLGAPSALGLAYRATSLEAESGKSLSASVLAGFVSRRLQAGSLTFDAAAAAELAGRDALVGSPIETEEHGRGIARGIDRTGALLLERPDGSRVSVVAGSVRFL